MTAEQAAKFERDVRRSVGYDPLAALYEGCCPIAGMCATHLALHKKRGGKYCTGGNCDVCRVNERALPVE